MNNTVLKYYFLYYTPSNSIKFLNETLETDVAIETENKNCIAVLQYPGKDL